MKNGREYVFVACATAFSNICAIIAAFVESFLVIHHKKLFEITLSVCLVKCRGMCDVLSQTGEKLRFLSCEGMNSSAT